MKRIVSTIRSVTQIGLTCMAQICIVAIVLTAFGFGSYLASADAQSVTQELPPRAKLENLVDHRKFEPTLNTCEHAAARCASLLQAIEDGKVQFIQPIATGKSARTTLERMCGSKYLAFYQEDPHYGSPIGPVITAKGPITLFQLPDLTKAFSGRRLYLARVEDDVQLGKPFDDGHLNIFSMPGCRRINGNFLEKSERYPGGTPSNVSRNEWISQPVIVGGRVFLLTVFHGYNYHEHHVEMHQLNITLISAINSHPNTAEIDTFRSK